MIHVFILLLFAHYDDILICIYHQLITIMAVFTDTFALNVCLQVEYIVFISIGWKLRDSSYCWRNMLICIFNKIPSQIFNLIDNKMDIIDGNNIKVKYFID